MQLEALKVIWGHAVLLMNPAWQTSVPLGTGRLEGSSAPARGAPRSPGTARPLTSPPQVSLLSPSVLGPEQQRHVSEIQLL